MKKLMNIRKNSKKGFTLIELVVVIVIIAILIAALTPAILGVIRRANIAADEADARTMMTVASVAATSQRPPSAAQLTEAEFYEAFGITATTNPNTGLTPGTYVIEFNGAFAYCVQIKLGGRSGASSSNPITVGNPGGTPTTTITVIVDTGGALTDLSIAP